MKTSHFGSLLSKQQNSHFEKFQVSMTQTIFNSLAKWGVHAKFHGIWRPFSQLKSGELKVQHPENWMEFGRLGKGSRFLADLLMSAPIWSIVAALMSAVVEFWSRGVPMSHVVVVFPAGLFLEDFVTLVALDHALSIHFNPFRSLPMLFGEVSQSGAFWQGPKSGQYYNWSELSFFDGPLEYYSGLAKWLLGANVNSGKWPL